MNHHDDNTAAARPRRGRRWLDVTMILSLVVMAVALYLVTPEQKQLAPIFDDLELLANPTEPAVMEELEFYYWLEQRHGQD